MDRPSAITSVLKRPIKEEKIPLKHFEMDGRGSRCAPYGGTFNIIVACMLSVTLVITIALVSEIARNPAQLLSALGTVTIESGECATISHNVLRAGGNAVDAAVAAMFCLSVTLPHAVSIGGGGFMMINFRDKKRDNIVIDFREMAPGAVPPESHIDGNAGKVAIPGVLRGMYMAHEKFGKLSWRHLVLQAAVVAEEGFTVVKSVAKAVRDHPPQNVHLQRLLVPNGRPVSVGDKVSWKTLSHTLRVIADEGADAFYDGNLTYTIIHDLNSEGGAFTQKDFQLYFAISNLPVKVTSGGTELYVSSLPSSGPALGLVFSLLSSFNDSMFTMLQYHHLIEAIKIATAAVVTAGSPMNAALSWNSSNNILSPESTEELRAHIRDNSAIALDMVPRLRSPVATSSFVIEYEDMSVATISGLGSMFGSQIVTSNGIVFNDAMEDFFPPTSTEDYKNNHYAPGRRALSTMASVALEESGTQCGSSLVASSSDYQVLVQGIFNMRKDKTLLHSFEKQKFRIALGETMGDVAIERNSEWDPALLDELRHIGHVVFESSDFVSSMSAILKKRETTEVYSK